MGAPLRTDSQFLYHACLFYLCMCISHYRCPTPPRTLPNCPRVLDWLKLFAEERGLAWSQDAAGNLVMRRPGGGGGEAAPTVIIQGHIDMVTEKNADVQHDFEADGIRLVRRDGWVTADGTTLGADNGEGRRGKGARVLDPC